MKAPAKKDAKAPAKKEVKAPAKEEVKKPAKPPIDLRDYTWRNVHDFPYNSFGPENPYP